jgi:F-box domain
VLSGIPGSELSCFSQKVNKHDVEIGRVEVLIVESLCNFSKGSGAILIRCVLVQFGISCFAPELSSKFVCRPCQRMAPNGSIALVQGDALQIPRPSLIDFPNEILAEIFNYLNVYDANERVSYYRNGKAVETAQIIALRSVCRLFRYLVNMMPFWQDNDLEFRNLMVPTRLANSQVGRDSREEQFITVMLTDKHLVTRFAKKKVWKFYNLAALKALMRGLPTFIENTTEVTLSTFTVNWDWEKVHPGIRAPVPNVAFNQLASCKTLRSLTLTAMSRLICLTTIAKSFPLLERFAFIQNDCIYNGNLDKLCHLREFVVVMSETAAISVRDPPFFPLPRGSVDSLTELSLKFPRAFKALNPRRRDDTLYYLHYFAQVLVGFKALKTLEMFPFHQAICSTVTLAAFALTDIDATFALSTPHTTLSPMLSATNLRNLVRLRLHSLQDTDSDHTRVIMTTISQNLSFLESLDVTFSMCPAHDRSLDSLVQLNKLQMLRCATSWQSYFVIRRRFLGGIPTPYDIDDELATTSCYLEGLFSQFEVPPSCTFEIIR